MVDVLTRDRYYVITTHPNGKTLYRIESDGGGWFPDKLNQSLWGGPFSPKPRKIFTSDEADAEINRAAEAIGSESRQYAKELIL